MTTPATAPTTNPAVSLTNDEAFSLTFSGGSTDAEGFSTGATLAPPTVSVKATAPDGTDISGQVLIGTDPAAPETFWFKRAPFEAGDLAGIGGEVTATFASGPVEVTPFAFGAGAAVGVSEAENVVPLSAIPGTVVFPAPAPAAPGTPTTGAAAA